MKHKVEYIEKYIKDYSMHSHICLFCDVKFSRKNLEAKFCSRSCRYRSKGIPKTLKTCFECNKQFGFYKSIKPTKDAKFCNISCRKTWNKNPLNKISHLKEVFLSKVIKQQDNACWKWNGAKFPTGYGQMFFMGKCINASRASWIIHYGLIKNKLWVLHKCDNPECTNPEHLFLGTCKDNVRDSINKGRRIITNGDHRKESKLNSQKVIEIRRLINQNTPYKEIMEKFSISMASISGIKNYRTWKHVN